MGLLLLIGSRSIAALLAIDCDDDDRQHKNSVLIILPYYPLG